MQDLLAEGDFVRSLARQLIGNADVDDLVQDTWITALRRRPRMLRQPRSWLARVVRRLASNRRRGDERRRRREHDAASARAAEAPSTAEILACEQARQRVVAAVLALEEPFRATILARFYEFLDTDAIAARDGVAVATVRSRLKRGLDRLRERLDAEHGSRAAWAAPLGLLGRNPIPLAIPAGVLMSIGKKSLVAGALLLLAGFSLWQWAANPTEPQSQSSAPSLHTAPLANASPDGTGPPESQRVAVDLASSHGEPRERVPYPIGDEPVDEVRVRVFDSDTRLPVAGAEMLYLPFRVDLEHPRARDDQALHEMVSSDVFLERFGNRAQTGSDGEATIRLPRRGGDVIASHGDRSVRARVATEQLLAGERATLWLEDRRWIRIRLIDAAGGPVAGALILVDSRGTSPVVRNDDGHCALSGPSDASGMLRIPWPRDRTSLRVRPWVTADCPWLLLDLPAALERVTELRFPATGSMTIELRTPGDQVWPGPIEAVITTQQGDSSNTGGPLNWREAEPGIYRIPRVGLGLMFKVRAYASRWDSWNPFGDTVATGPTQPGEDVRVVVTTNAEPCILWATLRMPDGSPPPASLRAKVLQEQERYATMLDWGRIAEDGRLGWAMKPEPSARGRIELAPTGGSQEPQLVCAWQTSASAGLHDLGTLVLTEPRVLVAGQIDVGTGGWQGPDLRVLCEIPYGNGQWNQLLETSIDPRRGPGFTIHGYTFAERMRVTVRPDRHFLAPEPAVVAVGTRDVRFVLQPGFALHARVIAPTDYARAVRCRAVREDGATLPEIGSTGWSDEPGRNEASLVDFDGTAARFLWPALPAGAYRVEVLLPGVTAPLAAVPGVRLAAGLEPDPRLEMIDVRGRTRMLTVSVDPLPRGPRPITEGGVLAFPAGARDRPMHGLLFDAHGEAHLQVGADPVDLVVAVPGFRLWRAQSVTDPSVRVVLEPCLEIPFRIAPRVAERLTGHRLQVHLTPRSEDDSREPVFSGFLRPGERRPAVQTTLGGLQCMAGSGDVTIDAATAAGTIPVSAPGRFRLRVSAGTPPHMIEIGYSFTNHQRSPVSPEEIEFTGPGTSPFVIDVEDETVTKLLEMLSQQR